MPNEEDIIRSINSGQNGENSIPDSPKDEQPVSRISEALAFVWETIKVIAISLAIIIPIRYYLVQPFFVKGASMETNFHDGDYLLIDEISYRFGYPQRGDVIVFRYPENPSQFFIKRIIGLPGETIEIKNDKVTIYNSHFLKGLTLEEKYLSPSQETIGNISVKIGDNQYYVLGDNRLQSSDSRIWGLLDNKFITGRAFLRLWPFTTLTKIKSINYE